MSCDINWDSFEKGTFQQWSEELLYDALNSGKRPHILSSEIKIKDLKFGKKSPIFEILEIGDLATDRFRGIFKLKYDGDANITLTTTIQASLLNIYEKNCQEHGGQFALPNFKLSSQPFSLPLNVKLSDIKLSGIIIIVFSKTKGLTLVFKNDPLENIKVSSTFDNVPVIERFLQKQIENQIRDLFRDILPSVLHKVSQKWTSNNILNSLHSKLSGSTNSDISLFEFNSMDPPELSPANMLRLSTLTTSRQSLRLSVPVFRESIDRQNVFKFDLNNNLRLESKNVPISLIMNNGEQDHLDNKIYEISKIQKKLYLSEKNHGRLKRRSIKLGRKREQREAGAGAAVQAQESVGTATGTATGTPAATGTPLSPTTTTTTTETPQKQPPHTTAQVKPQLTTKLSGFYSPISIPPSLILRSSSPRKSQSNLLSVGIGLNHHSQLWDSPPPPPYH